MKPRHYLWLAGLSVLVVGLMAMQAGCQRVAPPPAPPKQAEKPATKPLGKPAGEPGTEPVAKPEAKPSTKPEAEAGTKPGTEPAAEPSGKPAVEPPAETTPKPGAEEASVLPKVPLGLPPLPVPKENPMTPEKIELGKQLYFDGRLSKDGQISCATCHDPKMAYAEHEPTSTGIGKQPGGRNSPTVINAAYAPAQFWDGRAKSLEEQALGPIENPIEMGHKLDAMIAELSKLKGYEQQFKKVFGTGVTQDGVAQAIAAFERTILSGNSPYDRFKKGDDKALNEAQKRGLELFESAGCGTCHAPPLFSNGGYFNAGVGMDKEKPDEGRKVVTGNDRDLGKFRVPALREVANTWPYFHDGSAQKLQEAVALMAAGGKDNPNLSVMLKAVREAKLTEANQKDLVEFLNALSGEYPIVKPPKLP
jgi:cytochrome c peroxidase